MEKTLPRDAYVSDDWFDRERDRIFETQWFAVGRVEEFRDVVARQDWKVCQGVQKGMSSRRFDTGFYAPMEDYSMDIRRYIDGLM